MTEQTHLKVKAFLYKHLPKFDIGELAVDDMPDESLEELREQEKLLKKQYSEKFGGDSKSAEARLKKTLEKFYGPDIKSKNIVKNRAITLQRSYQNIKFSQEDLDRVGDWYYITFFVTSYEPKDIPIILPEATVEVFGTVYNKSAGQYSFKEGGTKYTKGKTDKNGFITLKIPDLTNEITDDYPDIIYYARISKNPQFFPRMKAVDFKRSSNELEQLGEIISKAPTVPKEGNPYDWVKLDDLELIGNDIVSIINGKKTHRVMNAEHTALLHRTDRQSPQVPPTGTVGQLWAEASKFIAIHPLIKPLIPRTDYVGFASTEGDIVVIGVEEGNKVSGPRWPKAYEIYHKAQEAKEAIERDIDEVVKKIIKKSGGNFKIDRFSIDLDPADFMRIDISDFVNSYNVSTDIVEGTPAWSITFRDGIVTGEHIKSPEGSNFTEFGELFFNRWAQYEATDPSDFTGAIDVHRSVAALRKVEAIKRRLNEQDQENAILLSDLIQHYNFISCFIYTGEEPIDELLRIENAGIEFFNKGAKDVQLTPFSLDNEVDLKYLNFKNNLNGYVMNKEKVVEAGVVDTVSVQGVGWSGLMQVTRTLFSPTLFTQSLYDEVETLDANKITLFQNIYADKSPLQIIYELLNNLYGIEFFTQWSDDKAFSKELLEEAWRQEYQNLIGTQGKSGEGRFQPQTFPENYIKRLTHPEEYSSAEVEEAKKYVNTKSFFDLNRLIARNKLQRGLFLIPPYLLIQVFKRHGYFVLDGNDGTLEAELESLNTEVRGKKFTVDKAGSTGYKTLNIKIFEILKKTAKVENLNSAGEFIPFLDTPRGEHILERVGTPTSPVILDPELLKLRTYFIFLRNGLSNFVPEFRTYSQILGDLKNNAYIEVFERLNGQMSVRTMRYNEIFESRDGEDVQQDGRKVRLYLTLDDIGKVINRTYGSTVKGLITKEKFEYQVDIIGSQIPFQHYFYSNGKLLLQYGLLEGSTAPNPNIKYIQNNPDSVDENMLTSVHKYARFVMELNNARLKRGSITCVGGKGKSNIELGKTFFDGVEGKFGYITGIRENVVVGGTYTISFDMSYVRDAIEVLEHKTGVPSISLSKKLLDLVSIANVWEDGYMSGRSPDSEKTKHDEDSVKITNKVVDVIMKDDFLVAASRDIVDVGKKVGGVVKTLWENIALTKKNSPKMIKKGAENLSKFFTEAGEEFE